MDTNITFEVTWHESYGYVLFTNHVDANQIEKM